MQKFGHMTAGKHWRLLCLLLAFLLMFSVFLAACEPDDDDGDNGGGEEETPEEVVVPLPILNGYFKDTASTGNYPRSATNWTVSGDSLGGSTADLTAYRGGILSTEDDIYSSEWDTLLTQKMQDYNNNPDNTSGENFVPLKLENPGTLFPQIDYNVLFLMNRQRNALRYASSSFTLPQGTHARIIVYVNAYTYEHETAGDTSSPIVKRGFLPGEGGAQITLTGATDQVYTINNISTFGQDAPTAAQVNSWLEAYPEDVRENEVDAFEEDSDVPAGWQRYEILVQGSGHASKNLTLQLGLGTGSSVNSLGYSEGYAFFDQVTVEYLTYEQYRQAAATVKDAGYAYNVPAAEVLSAPNYEATKPERKFIDASDAAFENIIAYSFNGSSYTAPALTTSGTYGLPSTVNVVPEADSAKAGIKSVFEFDEGFENGIFKKTLEKTVLDEDGKDTGETEDVITYPADGFPFAYKNGDNIIGNDQVYYLYNTKAPAAHYITLGGTGDVQVQSNKYYRVSFWLKSSAPTHGAITLRMIDETRIGTSGYSPVALTVNTTAFDIDPAYADNATNRSNKSGNWVQYSFYVYGGLYGNSSLKFELVLGPTLPVKDYATVTDFPNKENYVLSTGYFFEQLTQTEYNNAGTATNTSTGNNVSQSTAGSPSVTNGQFNDTVAAHSGNNSGLKTPASWTQKFAPESDYTRDDVASGVFNLQNALDYQNHTATFYNSFKNEFGTYFGSDYASGLTEFLTLGQTLNPNALLIWNKNDVASGFRAASGTLSANSYTRVSVRVRTLEASTPVYLYLVDANGEVIKYEGLLAEYEDEDETVIKDALSDVTNAAAMGFKAAGANSTATLPTTSTEAWKEYSFFIATGSQSLTYSLEVWVGSRDGATTAAGAAFFDVANVQTVASKEAFAKLMEDHYLPAGVTAAVAESADPAASDYGYTLVYRDFSKLYYEPAEQDLEPTEDSDDDGTDIIEETGCGEFDWWNISTVLIAVILLFALGSVVWRQMRKAGWFKKKGAPKQVSYDRNVKHKPKKKPAAVKRASYDRKKAEDDEDEDEDELEILDDEFEEEITLEAEALESDEDDAETAESEQENSDGTDTE